MPIAFSTIDWTIVAVYMVIATLPGWLCRKYIVGQGDFLLAGRTLSVWLATATLTATETGLVTVMYWAEFGYKSGFSAMTLGVISMVCTLTVGLTGFLIHGLRSSGATTVAEYYEQRFSRGVRVLGGLIIATAGILNYAIFLQVEATFVRIITGMPEMLMITTSAGQSWEVPTVNVVMSALLLIVLSYTFLGGMVSVVITDYIQFIVMLLGIGCATWWVLTRPEIGGLRGMLFTVESLRPGYGLDPTQRGVDSSGVVQGLGFAWIVSQILLWMSQNTWQTAAFRTAATDSPRTTQLMWIFTSFNYFGRAVIPMLWGIAAISYLNHKLGAAGMAAVPTREAMPLMLLDLPTGLIGFLTAGMLAALMSTHSSYLLAWGGVISEDLFAPITKAVTGISLSAEHRMWITRFFILCIGGFMLYYGLWFQIRDTIWGYLAMTGTVYLAGSFALLAMGLYWKGATKAGAYLGLLGGAIPGLFSVFASIYIQKMNLKVVAPDHWLLGLHTRLTDDLVAVISYPLAFAGMIIGSLIWKRRYDLIERPAVGSFQEAQA